jgi:thymidylate kinase
MVKYANNIEKYQNKEITKEQMREEAIEHEKWIRNTWMKQIYIYMNNEQRPDILIMDRSLYSTIIFMKTMIKEDLMTEEDLKEISKNYENWNFLFREALIIWWNTPIEESIKRLEKRGRTGENNLEYFENLAKTYKEEILKVYPNIKIITRETLLKKDQIDEILFKLINEEEIVIRVNDYLRKYDIA